MNSNNWPGPADSVEFKKAGIRTLLLFMSLLLGVAACKPSRESAQNPNSPTIPAVKNKKPLAEEYNSLIAEVALLEYLPLGQYPPLYFHSEWEVWIADERNLREEPLSWEGFDAFDQYDARSKYKVQVYPNKIEITLKQSGANSPLEVLQITQLPPLNGLVPLCLSASISGPYQNGETRWKLFSLENGQWKPAPDALLSVPEIEAFFQPGTDLSLVKKHSAFDVHLNFMADSENIEAELFDRAVVACDEENSGDLSPDDWKSLCETVSKVQVWKIVMVWDEGGETYEWEE